MATRRSIPNAVVALAATALAGGAFVVPYFMIRAKGENLAQADRPLSGATIMRGNYMNTGSKDAGVDPDWDLKAGVYRGYKNGKVRKLRPDHAQDKSVSAKDKA